MDSSISPINTAGLVKLSPPPVAAPRVAVPVPVPVPKTDTSSDEANAQAVKAVLASFDQTYAVSDKKFAIFKDATGKFITRYVSLRDGSVTYTPSPSFARPIAPQIAIKV